MTEGVPTGLSLFEGMSLSGMTYQELWLRQVSVGGIAGDLEVEAYVLGLLTPDRHQHDVLAQAINEFFLERGADHPVSYAESPIGGWAPPFN
jgi:hypothetical protein